MPEVPKIEILIILMLIADLIIFWSLSCVLRSLLLQQLETNKRLSSIVYYLEQLTRK
jgi:hypothetical protein